MDVGMEMLSGSATQGKPVSAKFSKRQISFWKRTTANQHSECTLTYQWCAKRYSECTLTYQWYAKWYSECTLTYQWYAKRYSECILTY